MRLNKEILLCNIQRLDKADYHDWEGHYDRANRLRNKAQKELGSALFNDVMEARKGNPHMTGEMTYKPICDRLREMGYEIC